jgi:hypothetical protein
MYLNQGVANEAVGEIMKKMRENIKVKGEENYEENKRLMKCIKVAIRDSRNLNRSSKYQDNKEAESGKTHNLWYLK